MTLRDESNHVVEEYYLQEWYLFWDNKFCTLKTSMHDFLVWEIYVGGLLGHLERNKTIEKVERQFFWSSLKRDGAKLVDQWQKHVNY